MRVGLIGAGAIARRAHLPALRAGGADVVAVCGGAGGSAQGFGDEHSVEVCADWRSLLARDDLDSVVIASPNAFHAEQALAAVDAGKHVLVEKPMTTTVADSERILAAAAEGRTVVMAAHNARFAPLVVRAREVARAQPVSALRLALWGSGPRTWSAGSDWFFDRDLAGGGVLLDLGVHVLDAARFVLDDELDLSSCMLRHDGGIDVEADVSLVSRSGVAVEVAVSWAASSPGFELTLTGSKGPLEVRPNLGVPADTVQAAFVRAVRGEGPAVPSAADGLAAVRLALAGYEAAR